MEYKTNEILKFYHFDEAKERGFIIGKFLRVEEFHGINYAVYEPLMDVYGEFTTPMVGGTMRCPMNGIPKTFGGVTNAIERFNS